VKIDAWDQKSATRGGTPLFAIDIILPLLPLATNAAGCVSVSKVTVPRHIFFENGLEGSL
jgi:hypothetical protein